MTVTSWIRSHFNRSAPRRPTGKGNMITDYKHPEYVAKAPLWRKVRDATAGEDAVKAAGQAYLPNPDETNAYATERYRAYIARAVYFNATGRTLAGLVGVAYANWPEIKASDNKLLADADGSGVSLINQSQATLADVLQTGRAGLLADWTAVDEVTRARGWRSRADQEAAGVRPFIIRYTAEEILTWETSGTRLTRVVLSESRADYTGGEVKYLPQLRELLLIDGKYTIKVWVKFTEHGDFLLVDTFKTGLTEIPFAFIGATNNDASPDQPPLLDLANLNLAHYRNSADFEESAFLSGQPQLVLTGVDQDWADQRGQILFGSRTALTLPMNADAKVLVAPAGIAKEAMLDKERMMVALGARLISPDASVKTATQSAAETRAGYAVLSLACDNVSEGYTKALRWATGDASASFALDTQFNDLTLDANAIREIVAAWQAGLVPSSDAYTALRKLKVIDQGKTDAQVAGEIEAQGPALNLDTAA